MKIMIYKCLQKKLLEMVATCLKNYIQQNFELKLH